MGLAKTIERNYQAAREFYAEFGVDTDSILTVFFPNPDLTPLLAGRRCTRVREQWF